MITPEEEENIFTGIWAGAITVFALPFVLFSDTFKEFQKALFRGFGANLTDFPEGSREFILLTKLRENLNKFSAAKTFQNVRDTQNFRLDEGLLRPFNEFRQDARKIFDKYNEDWLKTEFDTVVAASQSADQWKDIETDKKELPLLKYVTAGDERVRPEHAELDGIVRPVTDGFWDTFMPPNGFNCFEPNTKILTPNGWKKISKINRGEFVIGGSGEKRNVIGVHTNKSKTGLIKLESENFFVLCTPNHRILTTKGWIVAGELKKSDIIIQHPKPILQNTRIRNIDKVNTFIGNVFVSIVVKWNSLMSKTFNSQFQFRNINVNPIGRKIKVENRIMHQGFNIIKHYLFALSRLCFKYYVSFRMFFKEFFSTNSAFIHNILSSKRSIDFHFFRGSFNPFTSFFGFAKIRMWIIFKILFHKFSTTLTLFISSFWIINPLRFYSLTSFSGFNPKMFHEPHYSSVIHIPSFAKHSISKKSIDIKINNSVFSGAPLERFNSLKSFFRYSFFHFKFVKLDNITKIQYTDNVYNLSVDKDESYITELGIVHNCRCTVIQLEEGQEPISPIITPPPQPDPSIFNKNTGKVSFIFKDKGSSPHPYFKVPRDLNDLKKRNFNLPIL